MLQPPLDTSLCFYQAAAYDPANTLLPNRALLTEIPLLLGPTLNADPQDPVFVAETYGNFLRYTLNQGQYAIANIPPDVLNGDLWIALRYRTESKPGQPTFPPFAESLLLAIVDPHPTTPLKRFLLTRSGTNKIKARFFANNANNSQIDTTSTTSVSPTRTDTIVVRWSRAGGMSTQELYMNGGLEATVTTPLDRQTVVSSPLYMPLPNTTLKPAGWYLPLAIGKVWRPDLPALLQACPDWI